MIAHDTLDPFEELVTKGWVRPPESQRPAFPPSGRTLRPNSLAALVEIVRRANHAGFPFFFVGGGTRLSNHPLPVAPQLHGQPTIAIALDGLNRVLEFRPMDFTVTVEAGIPLAQLREQLAMRGQTLMLDSPHAQQGTIGGLLASGYAGPRRRSLGYTRDALLGAQLVLADGSLVESGGRVQRQASGYNLGRVMVGAHGCLGAYATLHLRTVPLPETHRCIVATLPEGTRSRVLASIEALPVEPTAALLIDGFMREIPGWEGPDGRVFLAFEGSETSIARATRDLRTALGAIGVSETRLFDRDAEALLEGVINAPVPLHHNHGDNTATIRLWGPPSKAVALRNTVHRQLGEVNLKAETITDLHNGDVYARVKAFGPRALDIAAREIFVELAHEATRASLLGAPASFHDRFTIAVNRERSSESLVPTLRSHFDPRSLYAIDRSLL